MIAFFTTVFYDPIFNLLVWLYNVVPGQDLGIAIILLTLIVKIVFHPLSKKSIKAQRQLQDINPEIEKIKEKYKDDKDKMGPELMALYKERKINPFSSCLPMLIQLPFLFAIYRVFYNGLTNDNAMDSLYTFVANPGPLNQVAFGFLNLADKNIWLAVLAGAGQYWQGKMMMDTKAKGAAGAMSKQMIYFMPIITVVIGSQFPAGLTLYWFLTTVFTVLQQYIVLGFKKKKEVEVVDNH